MKDMKTIDMTDLEQVTGGTDWQVATDNAFLCDMGLFDDRYSAWYLFWHWGEGSRRIDDAWKKVGVHCYSRPAGKNTYKINGKVVSWADVYRYTANKCGKTVDVDHYQLGYNW